MDSRESRTELQQTLERILLVLHNWDNIPEVKGAYISIVTRQFEMRFGDGH